MTGAKEHLPGGAESVTDAPPLHPRNPKLGEGPKLAGGGPEWPRRFKAVADPEWSDGNPPGRVSEYTGPGVRSRLLIHRLCTSRQVLLGTCHSGG